MSAFEILDQLRPMPATERREIVREKLHLNAAKNLWALYRDDRMISMFTSICCDTTDLFANREPLMNGQAEYKITADGRAFIVEKHLT